MSVHNITRAQELPEIERSIIMQLFDHVKNRAERSKWYEFDGYFDYKGRLFHIVCEFSLSTRFLHFRKREITEDRSPIILPPSCKW